jgi:hypothetical protein
VLLRLVLRRKEIKAEVNKTELIEQLASKEHASWSHWMKYLFSVCESQPDGSVTIPAHLVERWQKQLATPYEQLTEKEKQSDRNRVTYILPIIEVYHAGNHFEQEEEK